MSSDTDQEACMTFCLCLLEKRHWREAEGLVRSQWSGHRYQSSFVLALHILHCDELQRYGRRDAGVQICVMLEEAVRPNSS